MSEQTTKPTNKTNPSQWIERDRGCIWQSENKLNIHIKNKNGNIIKFIAFRNKYKDPSDLDSKHPDWRIYTDIKDYKQTPTTKESKPAPKKEVVDKAVEPETAPDF